MTPREEWQLGTRWVGRRVLVFDQTDSTNSRAVEMATEPDQHGLAVLADVQTAGRGQHGRTWHCPPRSGVLMSVVLFPPQELRRPPLLTAWAAVSVCETLQSVWGVQARIKWPNDVLIRGRKVCGILMEGGVTRAEGSFRVVVGIGLNLNQTARDFADAGLPEAGSLRQFTNREYDRDDVARRLLATLDEEYDRLLQGDRVTLEAQWKWRLGLLGKVVRAECGGEVHRGRVVDMGWEGLWLTEPDRAEPLCLTPESVRSLSEV